MAAALSKVYTIYARLNSEIPKKKSAHFCAPIACKDFPALILVPGLPCQHSPRTNILDLLLGLP